MVLKFCANLSFMFTEKTDNLLERYQLASQAGFKAVEFMFPYKYNIDDVVKVKLFSINTSFFCLIIWKKFKCVIQGQISCKRGSSFNQRISR